MLLEGDLWVAGRQLEIVEHTATAAGGAAILMLHEGLGSVAMWKSFPTALAARTGRRVIVYSRYGHGASDVLEGPRDIDYMHHEAQVTLPALIEQLDLQRPILWGHSDGASIALICAGTRPELVRALVLEAPHVFVEAHTLTGIVAARAAFAATDLAQRLSRYHRDAERTFRGWNDIWLDPRFRAWNIEPYLAAIECPVFLVQGEQDAYGTVAQLEAIVARVARTQVALLPACGHAPHRDQPAAVLDAIDEFLRTDASST